MALSNTLNSEGVPPQQLTVDATCTLDRIEGGVKITRMRIEVRGKVPGLDQARFDQIAAKAQQGCPVSNALRGNVEHTLTARLEQ
jgi:lipoyl-dependent peroxiredoxin